jgi:hypothetical protein
LVARVEDAAGELVSVLLAVEPGLPGRLDGATHGR